MGESSSEWRDVGEVISSFQGDLLIRGIDDDGDGYDGEGVETESMLNDDDMIVWVGESGEVEEGLASSLRHIGASRERVRTFKDPKSKEDLLEKYFIPRVVKAYRLLSTYGTSQVRSRSCDVTLPHSLLLSPRLLQLRSPFLNSINTLQAESLFKFCVLYKYGGVYVAPGVTLSGPVISGASTYPRNSAVPESNLVAGAVDSFFIYASSKRNR